MQAYLRDDRIVELQIGNIYAHQSEACSRHNFDTQNVKYITLTSKLFVPQLNVCN